MPKVGDKVRITGLMNDPHPLPVGTEGTVTHIANANKPHEQICVDWANGSSLMLVVEDRGCFRVVA